MLVEEPESVSATPSDTIFSFSSPVVSSYSTGDPRVLPSSSPPTVRTTIAVSSVDVPVSVPFTVAQCTAAMASQNVGQPSSFMPFSSPGTVGFTAVAPSFVES